MSESIKRKNYHKNYPNSGDWNPARIFDGAPRLASPSPAVDPSLSASDVEPLSYAAVAGKRTGREWQPQPPGQSPSDQKSRSQIPKSCSYPRNDAKSVIF